MSVEFSPLISCAWLNIHLNDPGLIIVDIRSPEEYQSHIPGAVNVPFPSWSVTRGELSLEMPDLIGLNNIIGNAGIRSASQIIVVHKTGNPYPLADAARVADTLIYAGVKSVAILDGGHDKWLRDGFLLSDVPSRPISVQFEARLKSHMVVDRDYVKQQLGRAIIVDARGSDYYFGASREAHALRPGHIPGAHSLPAPWIWNADGTYKDNEILRQIAAGITGISGENEIIIYCGIGGFTSAWWFVLTQLLGYKNVKFYDGSIQDWSHDLSLPMTTFHWD
jgi:thiosulfate/3-mercaptopyruvate sulfurtransferase